MYGKAWFQSLTSPICLQGSGEFSSIDGEDLIGMARHREGHESSSATQNVISRINLRAMQETVGDETEARCPLRLAEKFNGDLGRRFLDGFPDFFNGVGQPIGIDIYPYATPWANHRLLRF